MSLRRSFALAFVMTINIALLTELNDEEPSFEPLSALRNPQITQNRYDGREETTIRCSTCPCSQLVFAAGRGHRSRLQLRAKSAKDSTDNKRLTTRETNLVLLVVFSSALVTVKQVVRAGGYLWPPSLDGSSY